MASSEAVRYIVLADETARARIAAGRRSVRSVTGTKKRPPGGEGG